MTRLPTRILRETWKPLVILVCVLALQILALFELIPGEEALLEGLRTFFRSYGLLAVGVVSFFENLVVFNVYFPGSIVILVGMGMTHGNPSWALLTFVAITIPAQLSQILNYGIGRIRPAKGTKGSGSVSVWELILAFWHPEMAAIASLRCGHAGWHFLRFLFWLPIAALIWHTFWALVMYHVGGTDASLRWLSWLFYAYLAFWFLLGLREAFKNDGRNQGSSPGHGMI